MKKSLLSFALISAVSASAWNVSTAPEKQNILLEEFTGINCPSCPAGHERAAMLHRVFSNNIVSVTVHEGFKAVPSAGQVDLRVPAGTEIHNRYFIEQFGQSDAGEVYGSYPSAMVNRVPFETERVMGASTWSPAMGATLLKDSPVNLWIESNYEPSTRMLTVNLEGYYTADMTDPRLTVLLTQDHLKAFQANGGASYDHRHVLRDKLSENALGDPLNEKTAGEYFSRTYTYTVPEEIGTVNVDTTTIAVVAFVAEGDEAVVKVAESHPALNGLTPAAHIEGFAPLIPVGNYYAYNYLEIMVDNDSPEPITTADFAVNVSGQESQETLDLSADPIPAYGARQVRVPAPQVAGTYYDDSVTLSVRLTGVNGQSVTTSAITAKTRTIAIYPNELKLVIKADRNASTNHYYLKDADGNVVREFGPYPDADAGIEYTENVTLEPGKLYCLEVTDDWGDGVKNPRGFVKFYGPDDKMVAQNRDLVDYGARNFFIASTDPTSVDEIGSEAKVVSEEYFDLSGRRIAAPASGIVLKRQTLDNGTVRTLKMIVIDN